MKVRWLLSLLLLAAPPAAGAGVDIAWDGCVGDPGAASLRLFACDRNTGEDVLYVSFVPAVPFTGATLLEVALDLRTRSGITLPLWWQIAIPGCRRDQLGADPVQPSTPTCQGWIPAPFFFTSRYNFRYPTSDAAHLVVSTKTTPAAVSAGVRYIACRLLLRHSATVGGAACGGCVEPVDLTVSAVRLANVTAEMVLTQRQTDNVAFWQQDRPVSTRATTWGALKSLYR